MLSSTSICVASRQPPSSDAARRAHAVRLSRPNTASIPPSRFRGSDTTFEQRRVDLILNLIQVVGLPQLEMTDLALVSRVGQLGAQIWRLDFALSSSTARRKTEFEFELEFRVRQDSSGPNTTRGVGSKIKYGCLHADRKWREAIATVVCVV